MQKYNYKNCQSLFGYASKAHIKSKGQCQLCGCGGNPLDFYLWRQMTVEHLIGRSQGGYLKQIRESVEKRFPDISSADQEYITTKIDDLNTVTACSFCNSTTSRDVNTKTMEQLLFEVSGDNEKVLAHIKAELHSVLERKQKDVNWKIKSVKEAFEIEILGKFDK